MWVIQAVLFDKDRYTTENARAFLVRHGFHPIKHVHVTDNYLRYRIREPIKNGQYLMKEIDKSGIKLIFEKI